MKRCFAAFAIVLLYGCGSSPPPRTFRADELRGTAGWVGQEFAGRTTANGEIFDPMQLTAAHRTLPFGTIVTVKNTKSAQTVRVRINDRGPYISNRVIDLSYAAAKRIGLVELGGGPVELAVVKVGQGDREPPAPYVVSVPEVKPLAQPPAEVSMAPAATRDPSVVEARLQQDAIPTMTVPEMKPAPQPAAETPSAVPVIASTVNPIETRRQVSSDGTRVEDVPVRPPAVPEPAPLTTNPRPVRRSSSSTGNYAVQVGAFSQPDNAKVLMAQLARLGEPAYIDHRRLLVVYVGPFASREEAIRARERLERAGLEAIVTRR